MSDFADPLSSFAPVSTDEHPHRGASRPPELLRRVGGVVSVVANTLMTGALFLVLFAPPIVMAFVSVWAGVTGVRALWDGGQLLNHWQVGSLGSLLPSLNAASRLALFGVSFFATLFAMIVFMGGTFGRGWRHLFLVPGVLLAAPSLVVFVQSARMTGVLLTELSVARPLQVTIFAYLLLDALLLAFIMTDVRPRRRRNKAWRASMRPSAANSRPRDRRRSKSQLAEGEMFTTVPELPVVRFDLSSPFEEKAKSPAAVEESAPSVAIDDAKPEGAPSEALV
jgi:hypothetical protein